MAAAAFAGALVPVGIPLVVPIAAVLVAYFTKRAALLSLAVALLCSSLAFSSWAGLETELQGSFASVGTVVTDPVRRGGGTTAVLRIDDARVLVSAWGGTGARLGRADAGDRLAVEGSYRPYNGSRERKAALHVGTRATLTSVQGIGRDLLGIGLLYEVANGVRGRLDNGAASLSDERRALFKGLVYGDDRGQSALTEADFRLAGLTHLLAVSGQNVAYVLTLAAPAIRRASLRGRWIATLALLLLFATITRFEPSVLRATTMVGLAATGNLLGRESTGGRLLALAVTGLLVIDPLLATTIAFRLSVAASAGIAWLRPHLLPLLRGPSWLVETMGVTLSAQLAVAPVLITTFGPISLVSIPANVAAGPLAGAIMTWGMTMGLLAGFVPGPVAGAIHWVTSLLLRSLEIVARLAAMVPLAPVGLAWIAMSILCLAVWRRFPAALSVKIGAGAVAAILLVQLVPQPPEGRIDIGPSSEAWSSQGRTVLLLRDVNATTWLLDDLARTGIRRIDVLISNRPELRSQQVAALAQRVQVAEVLWLSQQETVLRVGELRLSVVEREARLSVE